jgi:hypothetical protein
MRTAPTLFAGIILCALVWYFAIVGLLTVMAAPVAEGRPSVSPLLPTTEVEGRDIVDISAYPAALRTEYRRTPVGDLTHIEIEYVTDASLSDVRAFYRTELLRHGWDVVHAYLDRGESAYVIVKEPRIGKVQLEAVDGMVQIEVELDLPGASRGTTTDR